MLIINDNNCQVNSTSVFPSGAWWIWTSYYPVRWTTQCEGIKEIHKTWDSFFKVSGIHLEFCLMRVACRITKHCINLFARKLDVFNIWKRLIWLFLDVSLLNIWLFIFQISGINYSFLAPEPYPFNNKDENMWRTLSTTWRSTPLLCSHIWRSHYQQMWVLWHVLSVFEAHRMLTIDMVGGGGGGATQSWPYFKPEKGIIYRCSLSKQTEEIHVYFS